MAELAAAIAGLIGSLVELMLSVVSAVFEALGWGALHLATKPEEGESRVSPKRLLVASMPLVAIVVVLAGIVGAFHWREQIRRARVTTTETLVNDNAERLANQVDKGGHFMKHMAATLDVDDAWGNPLRVTYKETLAKHWVVVRSAGDDEVFDTLDDITASRHLPRKKREIAADLLDKAKDAIAERIGNDGPNE